MLDYLEGILLGLLLVRNLLAALLVDLPRRSAKETWLHPIHELLFAQLHLSHFA